MTMDVLCRDDARRDSLTVVGAMVNEALCKILCHNLCVLIHSQCELGIEANFWGEEAEAGPDTLPIPACGE